MARRTFPVRAAGAKTGHFGEFWVAISGARFPSLLPFARFMKACFRTRSSPRRFCTVGGLKQVSHTSPNSADSVWDSGFSGQSRVS